VIKFFEGLSTYIFDMLRREFRSSLRGKIAGLLMRPGIARIRAVFDYERVGGSPLLGVKGTVIITHGRAKRRMIGFGVGVAATMARTRVPELIAEALRPTTASDGAADGQPADGQPAASDGSAAPPPTATPAAVESAS
jgi:glycerol-3-phosphate acyltransferase PlsX